MSVEQFLSIMAALTALITAAVAGLHQVVELRKAVNGRLTQLLALVEAEANLAGERRGALREQDAQAERIRLFVERAAAGLPTEDPTVTYTRRTDLP